MPARTSTVFVRLNVTTQRGSLREHREAVADVLTDIRERNVCYASVGRVTVTARRFNPEGTA